MLRSDPEPSAATLKRPDPVTVVMGLAVFVTGFSVFFYILFWAVAHIPGSNLTIDGEPVDRATFLARTKLFFEFFPEVPVLSGIVSFGFWKERLWAREAAVSCSAIALTGAVILFSDDFVNATFVCLAYLGVLVWSLYVPESVRTYYRTLRERAERPV